jgi:hypothetical protein
VIWKIAARPSFHQAFDTRRCLPVPVIAGHSHSIVNEHEKSFIFNAVFADVCTDTMKNTMFNQP